jgi:hypothetical protein
MMDLRNGDQIVGLSFGDEAQAPHHDERAIQVKSKSEPSRRKVGAQCQLLGVICTGVSVVAIRLFLILTLLNGWSSR